MLSVDTILGLVGVVLALIGLGIAIAQLDKTRNAVEASERATARTEKALALNRLLVLAPLLDRLEVDLDLAIVADDREAAMRHLASWRTTANPVVALLGNRAWDGDGELQKQVRLSVLQAGRAKTRLTDPAAQLRATTTNACRHIGAAAQAVGELTGKLQLVAREEDEGDA